MADEIDATHVKAEMYARIPQHLIDGWIDTLNLAIDTAHDLGHREWCDDPHNPVWGWAEAVAQEHENDLTIQYEF